MPRYYFHVSNGSEETDDQGHRLAGVAQARTEAVRYFGGLVRDDPGLLIEHGRLKVTVSSDDGCFRFAVVMTASAG
jgi:hypothetical protein